MKARAVDPHRALKRSILTALIPASIKIDQESHIPWTSITFSGARHCFEMTLVGRYGPSAIAKLSNVINRDQIKIAGHIVCDIVLFSHHLISSKRPSGVVLEIEALTVEA